MKHRGVKIVRMKERSLRNGRNHRGEKCLVDCEVFIGYSVIGVNYAETLEQAKATVDRLIEQVMIKCQCTEKEAVKLINES